MTDKKTQLSEFVKESYGFDFNGKNKKSHLVDSLNKSLGVIAKELYSSPLHFIFELIQNAEDNQYEDGVTPMIYLELLEDDPTNTVGADGCLAIFNNEIGFSFENVVSLSSVSESTKKEEKNKGYIGEKGIGFKSVFSVSTTPHIFSNGFNFKFKEYDENIGLGYIVPYWVDLIPEPIQEKLSEFNTCILLPIRGDSGLNLKERIAAELDSLDSEILIFLNKIQKINIHCSGIKRTFSKDCLNGKVTLSNEKNGICDAKYFNVFKKSIVVPDNLDEVKRAGVKEREICIAFNLSSDVRDLENNKLYAYLPTELFTGLPFLINADFLLPANRESVISDSNWNQWLIREVAAFAADTLADLLVNDDSFHYFSQIPITHKCKEKFLKPVFEVTLEKLKKCSFIPSISGIKSIPSQICFADKQITQLLGELATDEHRLHAKVISLKLHPYKAVLEDQLVQTVLDSEVIFSYLHASTRDLTEVSVEWYISLLEWLSKQEPDFHDKTDSSGVKILHKAPLFKTETGVLAVHGNHIFFAVTSNVVYPELATPRYKTEHKVIAKEFMVGLQEQKQVLNFVQQYFGIRLLNQSDFIANVALPFCEDYLEDIHTENLWSLTCFIAQHWFSISDQVKTSLHRKLPFKNCDGSFIFSSTKQLVTPKADEDSAIWKNIFSPQEQENFVILSDDYLKLFTQFESLDKKVFYNALKITSSPLPIEVKFSKAHRWANIEVSENHFEPTYLTYISDNIKKIDSTRQINMTCFNLPVLLRQSDIFVNDLPLSQLFMRWLLDVETKLVNDINIEYFYQYNRSTAVVSPLLFWLRNNKWLPTQNGLMRPSETFILSQGDQERYGAVVNFLSVEFHLSERLKKLLGISSEINSSTVLSLLQNWSKNNESTSPFSILKLYQQLVDSRRDLATLFANEALIYCPCGERKWFKANEVIWASQKEVLGDMFAWLSEYYPPSSKEFWLNTIQVKEYPDPQNFASVWLNLQNIPIKDGEDTKLLRDKLDVIYERLISYLKETSRDEHELWLEQFVQAARCFSQRYRWVDRSEVYISDEKKITDLFKSRVDFFWKTRGKTHVDFKLLYEVLGLKSITNEVKTEISYEIDGLKIPEKPILTNFSRLLLANYYKQLISRSKPAEDDWMQSPGIRQLLTVKERQLDSNIQIQYTLNDHTVSSEASVVFDDSEGYLIYNTVDREQDDLLDDLAEEISKLLVKKSFVEEQDHIRALLNVHKSDRFQKIFEKKHFDGILTESEVKLITSLHLQTDDSDKNLSGLSEVPEQVVGDERFSETQPPIESSIDERDIDIPNFDEKQWVNSSVEDELHNRFKTSENSANFGNSVSGTNLNPRSPSSSIAPNRSASSSFTPSGDATKPSSGNANSSQDRSSVQPKPYSGSRMISYVETYGPLVSPNSNTDNKTKRAQQIGQRAEEIVKDYLAGAGFSVIHRGGTNPGYDIEAIDEKTKEIFFVEVKGVAFNWNLRGVALSKTQMQKCLKYGDNFWLFIVEYVFGQPILHKLVNPHSKIDFYCFDSNWKLHQHPNDEFGITFNPKVSSSLKLPDINISESFFSSPQHHELYNKLQELGKGRHDVIDPELGYPLQNEQGAIILELEMAWPFVKKGVLIDEQHLSVEGWDLKTVEQVLDDLAWLPL